MEVPATSSRSSGKRSNFGQFEERSQTEARPGQVSDRVLPEWPGLIWVLDDSDQQRMGPPLAVCQHCDRLHRPIHIAPHKEILNQGVLFSVQESPDGDYAGGIVAVVHRDPHEAGVLFSQFKALNQSGKLLTGPQEPQHPIHCLSRAHSRRT